MQKLQHPTVMKIIKIAEDEDNIYIVMERFLGRPLFDKLAIHGPLDPSLVSQLIRDISLFLQFLHNQGIIYRDVKLENFLYNGRNLKVMNFGNATFLKSKWLHDGIGSPQYVAPEVLKEKYDKRSDIWSMGVCMYMLLKGNYPFNGKNNPDN